MRYRSGLIGTLLLASSLASLAQASGTKLWEFYAGNAVFAPAIDGAGILYFGSTTGVFYAFGHDGNKRWEFPVPGDTPVSTAAALAVDGTIYFGSNAKLYALRPDGTEKWEFATGGQVRSAPAISANGIIYFGSV